MTDFATVTLKGTYGDGRAFIARFKKPARVVANVPYRATVMFKVKIVFLLSLRFCVITVDLMLVSELIKSVVFANLFFNSLPCFLLNIVSKVR